MKIYKIPLAEYIACEANIAFAIGKYFTFGVAELPSPPFVKMH